MKSYISSGTDTHYYATNRNLVIFDKIRQLSDHVVEVLEESTLFGIGHLDVINLLDGCIKVLSRFVDVHCDVVNTLLAFGNCIGYGRADSFYVFNILAYIVEDFMSTGYIFDTGVKC